MSKSLVDGLADHYAAQTEAGQALRGSSLCRFKKLKSVALAVDPDQIGEAMAADTKLGVPTEYTSDGRPVFESRGHRKRFMQAHGYFDRDAGYGDAAPRHHKGEKAPPSKLRAALDQLRQRIRVRTESRQQVPTGY